MTASSLRQRGFAALLLLVLFVSACSSGTPVPQPVPGTPAQAASATPAAATASPLPPLRAVTCSAPPPVLPATKIAYQSALFGGEG